MSLYTAFSDCMNSMHGLLVEKGPDFQEMVLQEYRKL